MCSWSETPQFSAFNCRVWRGHRSRYLPLDATGSTITAGRYHANRGGSSDEAGWSALYTALDLAVVLGELFRSDPGDRLKEIRLTEIRVDLQHVADYRDLEVLGIDPERLFDDWDLSAGQALAKTARDHGAEAILVPSASRLGDNLVVFPDRLRPMSTLTVVRSLVPKLVKDAR